MERKQALAMLSSAKLALQGIISKAKVSWRKCYCVLLNVCVCVHRTLV